MLYIISLYSVYLASLTAEKSMPYCIAVVHCIQYVAVKHLKTSTVQAPFNIGIKHVFPCIYIRLPSMQ